MKANLDKNLAPAWVSGKSYSTGEFCLYNKRLYICTTDNSDAEFDNSKWERRNLVDLVSGINSNLIKSGVGFSNLVSDFGATASASSVYGSTFAESCAIDGNYESTWLSANNVGSAYIIIDLKSIKKINNLLFVLTHFVTNGVVDMTVKLSYSTDGNTYTEYTSTIVRVLGVNTRGTLLLTQLGRSARYIKLEMKSTYGGGLRNVCLTLLE